MESDPTGVNVVKWAEINGVKPALDTHTPRSASFPLMAAAAKLASGFAFRSDSLAESPANRVQSKRLLIVAKWVSSAGTGISMQTADVIAVRPSHGPHSLSLT